MMTNRSDNKPVYHAYSVLLASESQQTRSALVEHFASWFSLFITVESMADVTKAVKDYQYDIIIIELTFFSDPSTAFAQIQDWHRQHCQVLLLVEQTTLISVLTDWYRPSASLILSPINGQQAGNAIHHCMRTIQQRHKSSVLSHDFSRHHSHKIIGESESTVALKQSTHLRCHDSTPVLIQGEPGTGKELVARRLHALSLRDGPFVPLSGHNPLTQTLEQTLYGQVLNAENKIYHPGLFKQANGGTLYLDEIENLPIRVQQTLLKVFDTGYIRPVGADYDLPVDVRVVVATNRQLSDLQAARHPSPLLSRLYSSRITVVPLRQRKSDLKLLLPFFAKRLCRDLCLPLPGWTEEDIAIVRDYHWPGNVRELKNLVENCILLKQSPSDYWLRTHAIEHKAPVTVTVSNGMSMPTIHEDHQLDPRQRHDYPHNWTLKEVERHHIEEVVRAHQGNRSSAAKVLGVNRKTLERKFKEWKEEE
ncbi:MAG: sigma-54-dependent transcriptional regulator [Vibrio sp.]